MLKTVREIIIMLLVCVVAMLVLVVTLYKYRPNGKVVPEIVKYVATEEVQDLKEDNIDTRTKDDEVILTYEVTSGDLKGYQNSNIYVPGKSNPFEPYAEKKGSVNTTNTIGSNTVGGSNTNVEQETPSVYESKGTK